MAIMKTGKQILIFLASVSTVLGQGSLGTFTEGSTVIYECPPGAVCHAFEVTIPNYPYAIDGQISVRDPPGSVVVTDLFLSGSLGQGWWGRTPQNAITTEFFNSLVSSGHRIVQIRWNP